MLNGYIKLYAAIVTKKKHHKISTNLFKNKECERNIM